MTTTSGGRRRRRSQRALLWRLAPLIRSPQQAWFPPQRRRGDAAFMTPSRTHALTIDVEDYFHVTAFEALVPRSAWQEMPSRVVRSTQRLLEILARRETRATFFVLGWVAEHKPELVHEI